MAWEPGSLEPRSLGSWTLGALPWSLGAWEPGRLGDWEIVGLEDWETVLLGDWETG